MSQVAGQLKAYPKFPLHDGHRIQNNKPRTAAIAATKPSRPIKINALLFVPSVMPVAKTTKASNINEKRRLRLRVNFCLIVSILFVRTRQLNGGPEAHLSRTPGSPSRSAVTLFAAQLPRSPERSGGWNDFNNPPGQLPRTKKALGLFPVRLMLLESAMH